MFIPTQIAERRRLAEDKARVRRARYEVKRSDPSHGKGKGSHHPPAPFIFWDGEGPQDSGYSLFGNSAGDEICHPYLSTAECIDLILWREAQTPNAIHTSFGFNYDVSMILKDLSWRHLSALHKFGRTVWRDCQIEHIPHKWFKVRRGNLSATIYDIRSFCDGDYVSALHDFDVGDPAVRDLIAADKKRRGDFLWKDINEIRRYWLYELSMGPLLCESLRTVLAESGYVPRAWYGPSALARMAFRRHGVRECMSESPDAVRSAAQHAFAGGRFELFQAGHAKATIHNADIRSAYPYFATALPNLARGRWRYSRDFVPGKFAVWDISYDSKPDAFRIYPLFRRMPSGQVAWPHRVRGWYWQPEAELVANDPDAVIHGGWVFEENDPANRPFAWLADYYTERQVLKEAGNPAEYAYKKIINAVYGITAQRAGWDRRNNKAPGTHQLEWAGFITSGCRARVYRAALACGDKLVSIDTDGIASLAPVPGCEPGRNLGDWEITEYRDGVFFQSGMYSLKEDLGYDPALDYDTWKKAKTRGIPKGAYTADELIDCVNTGKSLKLTKNVFIGYGLADNGRRAELNTWFREPHEFAMGGSGKRLHFPMACRSVCGDGMHRLGQPLALYGPEGNPQSVKHYLPWEGQPTDNKRIMDDYAMYSVNDLDSDDYWIREYA